MKKRAWLICVLLAASAAPSASHADILWDGSCAVVVSFSFSAMNLASSPSTNVRMSGGSLACVNSDTSRPLVSVSFSGSGPGSLVGTCEAWSAGGGFGEIFSPSPPPGSSGTWTFTGNVGGGELDMLGTSSTGGTVVEAANLVLHPLTATGQPTLCAQIGSSGATSLIYVGTLLYADP